MSDTDDEIILQPIVHIPAIGQRLPIFDIENIIITPGTFNLRSSNQVIIQDSVRVQDRVRSFNAILNLHQFLEQALRNRSPILSTNWDIEVGTHVSFFTEVPILVNVDFFETVDRNVPPPPPPTPPVKLLSSTRISLRTLDGECKDQSLDISPILPTFDSGRETYTTTVVKTFDKEERTLRRHISVDRSAIDKDILETPLRSGSTRFWGESSDLIDLDSISDVSSLSFDNWTKLTTFSSDQEGFEASIESGCSTPGIVETDVKTGTLIDETDVYSLESRPQVIGKNSVEIAEPSFDNWVGLTSFSKGKEAIENKMDASGLSSPDRIDPYRKGTFIVQNKSYDTYSGKLSENHTSWLLGYISFCNAANYTEKERCQIFPTYLRGEAVTKYYTWPEEVKNDWDRLKTAFLEYGGGAEREHLWGTELARTKLEEGGSVDEYIQKMRDLGTKIGLAKREIARHMVNNLTPALFNAILPFGLSDLDEIVAKLRLLGRGKMNVESASKTEKSERSEKFDSSGFNAFAKGIAEAQSTYTLEMSRFMSDVRNELQSLKNAEKQKSVQQQITAKSHCLHCGLEGHVVDECQQRANGKPPVSQNVMNISGATPVGTMQQPLPQTIQQPTPQVVQQPMQQIQPPIQLMQQQPTQQAAYSPQMQSVNNNPQQFYSQAQASPQVVGLANYTGCHLCGSREHYARQCGMQGNYRGGYRGGRGGYRGGYRGGHRGGYNGGFNGRPIQVQLVRAVPTQGNQDGQDDDDQTGNQGQTGQSRGNANRAPTVMLMTDDFLG